MATATEPPIAQRVPHSITQHGATRDDPYFWLRDRDNPDVIAYLEAENAYTTAIMQPTEALQAQLYTEMRGRIKEDDTSAPVRRGDYWYYTRTEEGQQYPINCRKHGSLQAAEEVLLDQNILAAGTEYFRVGVFEVSPNQRLLAYSVDTSGNEDYTIFVKDLATGALLPDQISGTYYSCAWANDNRTFFYTIIDDAHRPYKLMRHTLGSAAASDMEAYHEPDEAFFLQVKRTRSNAFVLINLGSNTTSEVRYLHADQPDGAFAVVQPREQGHEYKVEHHGEQFLIVSNDGAQNFKLMSAPVATPSKEHWHEMIGPRPTTLIEGVDAFADVLAVYEREQGLQRIRLCAPDGGHVRYVPFPEPVYAIQPGPNPEWNTATLRFTYSSLVTPRSVIDYDTQAATWTVQKQDEIPSGYDATQYTSERVFATAPDGTPVPVSLVYKRGLERNGQNPTLLYGYGSYGFSMDPTFSTNRLSLLDRGFVFALAHIRGGSELGRPWYDNGKLLHKKNTFTDFIACAEYLIEQGYTNPSKLAIMGGSAGGLLMGAVTNMRPDLFRAVVLQVPFVDVINTMSDPTLPLTIMEYEEWGNPQDPTYFEYIRSYSPYDNAEAKAYPNMLFTAGLNDPRVSYWEPAKMAAKLRTIKTDDKLLLLRTNMGAGHGGASGRYDFLKEIALDYAFVIETVSGGVQAEG